MDQKKIPQNPYNPPPSQPPVNHHYTRFENHPLMITQNTPNQEELESVFSRLNLSSQDYHPNVQTPPFNGVPRTPNGAVQSAFGENHHQPLFWGQTQISNVGFNGLVGPHPSVNVGHREVGFSGVGPFVDMGHQRQDLGVGGDYDYYGLHGKQTVVSRRDTGQFPILPSSNPNTVYGFYENPISGFYNGNQYLSQLGSGVLNLKLDEGWSDEEIEVVLSEVMGYLGDLMMNQFGSHFVEKLFMVCNEDQKTRIVMALCKYPFKLVKICLSSYGARAVQKLMEKLIAPQQISFVVSALSHGVLALATDPNGQHVIQYCVKHFHEEYNRHLFNEMAENCYRIATNKSGCCVLQSCVEHSHGEVRDLLISQIIANAVPLAEDPYGNYVVQYLLGMRSPEVTAELLRQFQGFFVSMSCNKYASNVVEKFFLESGESHCARVILEILRSPKASMLLLDPYGNFVIQSALSKSKENVREALLNLIKANASYMQTNLYGKKILAWFEKKNLHNA